MDQLARDDVALPAELRARLSGYSFHPVTLGESGAVVWRCTIDGRPPLYLKCAPLSEALALDAEAARLRWMMSRGVPVPHVRDYSRAKDSEYLLLDEVPGVPASDREWLGAIPGVIVAMAQGLRSVHAIDVLDCPFDQTVLEQVEEARARITAGLVREDEFDDENSGRAPADLLAELIATVPERKDFVFTHGDFCPPNIILRRQPDGGVEVAGLIDCGRAGIADRYQDLALAERSIAFNFGAEWVAPFFAQYGLTDPDEAKLRFYRLLDEFF